MTIATPQEMIRHNAPNAIGITNVVLWVTLTRHANEYLPPAPVQGLLKILEVGLGGEIIQGVFSRDGIYPFVAIGEIGASLRGVSFEVGAR